MERIDQALNLDNTKEEDFVAHEELKELEKKYRKHRNE